MEDRSFDAEYLFEKYSLKTTTYDSRVPYRLVIPIRYNHRDISYTARSYVKGVEPRYISCEGVNEVIPHKDTLYNIDNIKSRNVVVCEGAFDVFRINGGAVASYGTKITLAQLPELL